MNYIGKIFRPPSEAYSLIVQITIGCSHNQCTFCSMYRDKKFSMRKLEDILSDLAWARKNYSVVERIFLADGDALIAKTETLVEILEYIRIHFPECQRVASYASPKSITSKSDDELKILHDLGLEMLYMGLESGSDTILKNINKGESVQQIINAGIRIKNAGIKLSVTAISGLGGKKYLEEHAIMTAKAFSLMKPQYIGFLTLMLEVDTPLYQEYLNGDFFILSPNEVCLEMKLFLQNIDSEDTIFRANHASNYLSLAGTLNTDREAMLALVEKAFNGDFYLKSEKFRRL